MDAPRIATSCDNFVKFAVYYPDKGREELPTRRILIVEDEMDIAELVALHLRDLCDEAVIANDGHEGLRLATCEQWAAITVSSWRPLR